MEKQKYIPINALWRIRQANGLELKQVAKLLGHRSSDSISHYEKSNSHPNLKTAVKLMLIYNSDLKEMFPDLFDDCRREIEENLKKYSWLFSIRDREKLDEHINSCSYEEMFNSPHLTENDKTIIRRHITKLANKLAYL